MKRKIIEELLIMSYLFSNYKYVGRVRKKYLRQSATGCKKIQKN